MVDSHFAALYNNEDPQEISSLRKQAGLEELALRSVWGAYAMQRAAERQRETEKQHAQAQAMNMAFEMLQARRMAPVLQALGRAEPGVAGVGGHYLEDAHLAGPPTFSNQELLQMDPDMLRLAMSMSKSAAAMARRDWGEMNGMEKQAVTGLLTMLGRKALGAVGRAATKIKPPSPSPAKAKTIFGAPVQGSVTKGIPQASTGLPRSPGTSGVSQRMPKSPTGVQPASPPTPAAPTPAPAPARTPSSSSSMPAMDQYGPVNKGKTEIGMSRHPTIPGQPNAGAMVNPPPPPTPKPAPAPKPATGAQPAVEPPPASTANPPAAKPPDTPGVSTEPGLMDQAGQWWDKTKGKFTMPAIASAAAIGGGAYMLSNTMNKGFDTLGAPQRSGQAWGLQSSQPAQAMPYY